MSSSLFSDVAAFLAGRIYGADERQQLMNSLAADSSDLAQAWMLALRPAPPIEELLRFGSSRAEVRCVVARAAKEALKGALLALDTHAVESFAEVHGLLARGLDTPRESVGVAISMGWLAWCRGEDSTESLAHVGPIARSADLPELVIEAKALEALHQLALGDVASATKAARLASRMARTEGIPDAEVLANIVLARVRRFQNKPHLALLILARLAPHAPPRWRPWMEWEAVLAGALSVRAGDTESAANALVRLADAARAGDQKRAAEFAEVLTRRTAAMQPLADDASDARSLLFAEARAEGNADAWKRGTELECPPGIAGLVFAGAGPAANDSACAHVLVVPGSEARRLPAIAAPLAAAWAGANMAPAEGPTRPRSDEGLSVLALAGAPVETSTYFQQVYGFAFDNAIHASTLSMHLQRMRERLGAAGDVERLEGAIALKPHEPLLLRDPRCEEPLAQRVLRIIATTGRRGAGDLAKELGMPLRTIQRALKELHAGEDVVLVKKGRSVGYQVEDTTFSEPTRSRKFEGGLIIV